MATFRTLGPDDQHALETFLRTRTDSSMFLLSNLHSGGITYRGEPYQAQYVAKLVDARITAVAAHCWNGNVLLQAPESVAELMRLLAQGATRPVDGLVGPWTQVVAARESLSLADAATRAESSQDLFSLELSDLIVPEQLATGQVACRRSVPEDRERLVAWSEAYNAEALGATEGPALHQSCASLFKRHLAEGNRWVLSAGGQPVAMAALNAQLPDCVQLGSVWTPPALRGRGYARCVVAGALKDARNRGVRRAVLFAHNPWAKRAYRALGFRFIGNYGSILFVDPQLISRRPHRGQEEVEKDGD